MSLVDKGMKSIAINAIETKANGHRGLRYANSS